MAVKNREPRPLDLRQVYAVTVIVLALFVWILLLHP
jgi:hypothetical protein